MFVRPQEYPTIVDNMHLAMKATENFHLIVITSMTRHVRAVSFSHQFLMN